MNFNLKFKPLLNFIVTAFFVSSSQAVQAGLDPLPTLKPGTTWQIKRDSWTPQDEKDYSDFIQAIGQGIERGVDQGGCDSMSNCLNNPSVNPLLRPGDETLNLYADCAKFPYQLRAYFALKKGLPFSYISGVVSRLGKANMLQYSPNGNLANRRRDLLSTSAPSFVSEFRTLETEVSTATLRQGYPWLTPAVSGQFSGAQDSISAMNLRRSLPDFYSPAIRREVITPGTVIYEPQGHAVIVYKYDSVGRIQYIDAHPDNSLTHGYFNHDFIRVNPWVGAGFKKFRPQFLIGATRAANGTFIGGAIYVADDTHPMISNQVDLAQYFGVYNTEVSMKPTDPVTQFLGNWQLGTFTPNVSSASSEDDYYRWVRTQLAPPGVTLTPMDDFKDQLIELCQVIDNRNDAVQKGIDNKTDKMPHLGSLPSDIYGTGGVWENFSTSARDIGLRGDFVRIYNLVQSIIESTPPPQKIQVAQQLFSNYQSMNNFCNLGYTDSLGQDHELSIEKVRAQLFKLSFDPYHCIELRWGETQLPASCLDPSKLSWYQAEQRLRNQTVRNDSIATNFTLQDLLNHREGPAGQDQAPDTDVIKFLQGVQSEISAVAPANTSSPFDQ